jgi:hypothetical protein
MNTEQAIRAIEITQTKLDELFEEIKAELLVENEGVAGTDPIAGSIDAKQSHPWSLSGSAPTGQWERTDSSTGVRYKWPDGNVDEYSQFIHYVGRGEFEGVNLALGYLDNGDVVGFSLGTGGGSKRGITYFFPADDFETTREKISMIRGGGPNGRSGFGSREAVPPAYAEFETAILRERKAGKWRVLGVVVAEDDAETMLRHTALQARLRNLA